MLGALPSDQGAAPHRCGESEGKFRVAWRGAGRLGNVLALGSRCTMFVETDVVAGDRVLSETQQRRQKRSSTRSSAANPLDC